MKEPRRPAPLPHAVYARVVRAALPASCFERTPRRLWNAALHLAIYALCVAWVRQSPIGMRPLLALVAGHCLAGVAFLAHDLGHGALLRAGPVRSALETALWGLNLVPRTLWRRVHNETHHVHAGTLRDPDRAFLTRERTRARLLYDRLLYPGRGRPLRWNPLALLHFPPYVARNLLAALLPAGRVPSIVPSVPSYTVRERRLVLVELVGIALAQGGLFALAGGWRGYVWVGPIALLVTSSVTMLYIFTNHFLAPLSATPDPVLGSTSVVVPGWMDALHDRFSHHVEHHLFPSMSPRYFPAVRAVLLREFPERYRPLPLFEAWRRLADRPAWAWEEAGGERHGP